MTSVLLMMSSISWARPHDFGLSLNPGIKKTIIKPLAFTIDSEIRTQKNSTKMERISLELGLAYKPIKYFKLEAAYQIRTGYKLESVNSDGDLVSDYWRPKQQATLAVSGMLPIAIGSDTLELSLRLKYQYAYSMPVEVRQYDDVTGERIENKIVHAKHEHLLRSRIQVSYKISKLNLKPYVSFEIFNKFHDHFKFDTLRTIGGLEYELAKKHTFIIFYRNDTDMNVPEGLSYHMLGLSYKFAF